MQRIAAGRRAVIRGIFTMPAARQTSGRLSMQRLGLNIYSWQPRKENARICRRASAFSMVQLASAATCVLTRLVSRAVCRLAAAGRLAETAVDGPRRAGDMYQNPAARLWLIEDVGMYKPTVLRTGEPGTTEVVAFLS
jgi:hypothetical protein